MGLFCQKIVVLDLDATIKRDGQSYEGLLYVAYSTIILWLAVSEGFEPRLDNINGAKCLQVKLQYSCPIII